MPDIAFTQPTQPEAATKPYCENVFVLPALLSVPAEAGRWELGKPVSSAMLLRSPQA